MLCCSPCAYPAPALLSQMIIAGSSDDVSAQDMMGWISPILQGIPGRLWLSCVLAPSEGGVLSITLRSGWSAPYLSLHRSLPRQKARTIRQLLPDTSPAIAILVNEHAPQILTLLDGMAGWLNLFDTTDPALSPIMSLLAEYGSEADTGDEKGLLLGSPSSLQV